MRAPRKHFLDLITRVNDSEFSFVLEKTGVKASARSILAMLIILSMTIIFVFATN